MAGEEPGQQDRWARIYFLVGLFGFATLVIYVLSHRRGPLYDERWHLAPALDFNASPSFKAWLLGNTTSAPGPVFALMHYALSFGHGALPAPWLRLPNLVLLAIILWLTSRHIQQLGRPHPHALAVSMLAVPMTWVLAGLALTEIPAMSGVALALLAGFAMGQTGPSERQRQVLCGLGVAAGIAIAVCGRQTYLAVVPTIFLVAATRRQTAILVAAAIALGLVPAGLLFLTWHGLIPPGTLRSVQLERGFRPEHVVFAFGYAGIVSILIAPRLFLVHPKRIAASIVAAVVLNSILLRAEAMPLRSVVERFHSQILVQVLTWASGQVFAVVGGAFLASLVLEMYDRRRDKLFIAHALGIVFLCFECGGMSYGFSSRYIGMGLPVLVPLLSRYLVFGPWATGRLLVGMALGAASLHSYFTMPP